MRTIPSEDYMELVCDKIEDDLNVRLLITFNALADRFGFPKIDDYHRSTDEFDVVFWEHGYATKMRDLAIEMFEMMGMDVIASGEE